MERQAYLKYERLWIGSFPVLPWEVPLKSQGGPGAQLGQGAAPRLP